MRYFLFAFALAIVSVVSILGFRGDKTTKRPLEVFPDMDDQSKYKPQTESDFFSDGRADRLPVQATIARGFLKDDDHYHLGKDGDGWATGFPERLDINNDFLVTGQKKYTVYCAVCHGGAGDGNGVTKSRGMIVTPSYHNARLRDMPEGEVFNTITNGKGLMGYYKDKLSVEERWAVIAYVRALQLSQNASVDDVPQSERKDLGL